VFAPAAAAIAQCLLFRLMENILRSTFAAVVFAAMTVSSGCQKKTSATDVTSPNTPGNTKPLEAADLVGYNGKLLRKSVDRIKDANEKHNQQLEKIPGSDPDQ
jgi:hypothetical protein